MWNKSLASCVAFGNLLSQSIESSFVKCTSKMCFTFAIAPRTHICWHCDDIRLHSWFYITQNIHLPYRFTLFSCSLTYYVLSFLFALSVNLRIILTVEHCVFTVHLTLPARVCVCVSVRVPLCVIHMYPVSPFTESIQLNWILIARIHSGSGNLAQWRSVWRVCVCVSVYVM